MSDLEFKSPFERKSTVLHITEISKHQSDFSDLEALHEAPEDENTDANTPDEGFEEAPADAGDDNANTDDTANEDNEDFNIDASDDNLGDDLDGTGGTTGDGDDTAGGDNGSPEAQVDVDNEAKQKDREIFDTLSPQEQKIKTIQLKKLYMDLYTRCDQIIDKYNTLGVDYEDLGEPVHRCVDIIYNLKQMISTYLLYLFDSKSYFENDIKFNEFLVVLNKIKVITKDMKNAHIENIEATKKRLKEAE